MRVTRFAADFAQVDNTLQTRLEKVAGRLVAILVSVTLLTAWHIPTWYFLSRGVKGTAGDLMSVVMGTGIPVFIFGLIFALFWDRYRSLLPLVAARWGVDILHSNLSFLGIGY
jgi:membrane protease YdiL (CAAX protease family)